MNSGRVVEWLEPHPHKMDWSEDYFEQFSLLTVSGNKYDPGYLD